MLTLTIPWPPTVNKIWRHVVIRGQVRVLVSAEGRTYRDDVAAAVGRIAEPLSGGLALEIDAHPPDHRRRDLDNTLKAVLDALAKAGVYGDDYQLDDVRVRRCGVVEGGRLECRLWCVRAEAPLFVEGE